MAVGPDSFPDMYPVVGVRLSTVSAGIKKPGRKDLVLIECAEGSQIAAVFTKNSFCAAPVVLAKQHLQVAAPKYLLINTGNANAGTGEQGLQAAKNCCEQLAQLAQCDAQSILPFSTGVIGEPLPVQRLVNALPMALQQFSADGWAEAAQGILTTDTRPKGASVRFEHEGKAFHVTGIAKGSGMIRPDMATMLAFIATDVPALQPVLQRLLESANKESFNRITVDGDTSTNDACVLIATGTSGDEVLARTESALYEKLLSAVTQVCVELAQAIIKDGEGATKFIRIEVDDGKTEEECLLVAYAIAHSPLVKTALFASDPNWGRILAVVGRAGLENLDVSKVDIYLDDICIAEQGGRAVSYTEAQGQAVMNQQEITIRVKLGRGQAREKVWTCDLSHDYVSINADYRS
ncbi:MAG: bifunctional glutamate N-acetyltransferase/amino-acid acetyltransferase ArgJ [Pseudomonadales bacterium]|nr:bifunctional glutamate N-acetyltransferase/amino-acid acetyltransferase ArgJ [Pseudomonadales bacterium]